MKKIEKVKEIINELYNNHSLETREKIKLYRSNLVLIRKLAYQNNAEAQFELGLHYEDINFWGENLYYDDEKCFYWYTKAANNKHGEACNSLATMYESGLVTEKDIKKAIHYYELGASYGNELAKENLEILIKQNKM